MIGILIFTGIALVLALLLVFISEKYKVEDKAKAYEQLLPGFNCGACGYGTCAGLAKAMERDVNLYQSCKPLRGEQKEALELYLRSQSETEIN